MLHDGIHEGLFRKQDRAGLSKMEKQVNMKNIVSIMSISYLEYWDARYVKRYVWERESKERKTEPYIRIISIMRANTVAW